MAEHLCVDLFTPNVQKWMSGYEMKAKNGPYGTYFTATVTKSQKNKLIRTAYRHGVKYRVYEERWERSADYRANFFKAYPGPYRCRYCNRKLSKRYMVIDHLIPVAKAKVSSYARFCLKLHGITNVNDVRNLVPSCDRCNRKKGAKMGLWVVRGRLGKYKLYWIIRRILIIALIVFAVIGAWNLFMEFGPANVTEKIVNFWN